MGSRSNNKSNSGNSPSSSLEEAQQAIWDETARGMARVLTNIRHVWYASDEAMYYNRERQNLEKYVQPLYIGAAATVFLFVNFSFLKVIHLFSNA